jgi:hypothetical protein
MNYWRWLCEIWCGHKVTNIATLCSGNTVSVLTFKNMITVQMLGVMSGNVRRTEIKQCKKSSSISGIGGGVGGSVAPLIPNLSLKLM